MSAVRAFGWLIAGMLSLALLTQPVSVQAQLALSLTIIAALVFIWVFDRDPSARLLFLSLASFVTIRYMYWRLTCTLPPASDPIGLGFGLLLFFAELYCFLILAVSWILNVDPLRRKPVARVHDALLPVVDVLIPTYNEEQYILATTLSAVMSMDYPKDKLNVWLLDDGGTDQKCNDEDVVRAEAAKLRRASLREMSRGIGATYLTREKNEHAKAGNMNNALAHLKGDIVVVFDADHAPFRTFLGETAPLFLDDPTLFLVQTPHFFLNPDPIERNLRTFDRMPSENEMFYSTTQCGLDKWNASFFCGSAALLRRSALMEIGGFSGVTITEDCETAFELHSKGYSSAYVDKPLIAGLQPETFSSFIGQRVRWCQGMLQIMLLKNPLLKKGLSPIQKLGYLSSMTFWFFPFSRLIFMLAPLVYILFDVKIFVSSVDEAVAFTLTYMVVNVMVQNYLYGSVRWPWISELYEYCQGVFLSKAVLSVIWSPRKPIFKVTSKGLILEEDHLSELAWPFFAIYLALLGGSIVAAIRSLTEPSVSGLMMIVGLWNTFNLNVAGVALGVVSERKQLDRHPRLAVDRKGVLEMAGARYAVEVVNVSAGGCALRFPNDSLPPRPNAPDAAAKLFIEPFGDLISGRSLRLKLPRSPSDDGLYGCIFETMLAEEYFVLADLMYGDSEALPAFISSRRKHKSIWAGGAQFVLWGITEPVRAFAYLLKKRQLEDSPERAPALRTAIATLRTLATIGGRSASPTLGESRRVA
jgi:cellulose synthase (UDP-forming)